MINCSISSTSMQPLVFWFVFNFFFPYSEEVESRSTTLLLFIYICMCITSFLNHIHEYNQSQYYETNNLNQPEHMSSLPFC